jgi:DNA-binding Xre family transcriptional regulator
MTGIQLKSILYKTGLTQIELAEKMGMSQQNFNKSLMVKDIKTGFLEKLCEVLNVKMSFFYPDDYDRGGGSFKSAHSATAVGSENTATTGASDDMVRQLLSQNQQLIDIIKNNL